MPDLVGKASVATPSAAYNMMLEDWMLIDDLLGGTRAMRNAGERWLPKEEREEHIAYLNRLNRTVLYGAFKDTIKALVSKPFSRPVILRNEEKLPEQLREHSINVNHAGQNITQFARDLFTDALERGKTHVLVDYPQIPAGATKADERRIKARPLFTHVRAKDLIGWQAEQTERGWELSQIRIREDRMEPDGDWGERLVRRIRVVTPGEWVLWKFEEASAQQGAGEWREEARGSMLRGGKPLDYIPLVTLYLEQTGYMTAESPLMDLAWLNLAHWQSWSDQRNILRFVRSGLLFISGLTDDEMQKEITLGPNRVFRTTNEKAQAKWVEHTGNGVKAGELDLQKIEERMKLLGMRPLTSRPGLVTATEKAIDEAQSHTAIQAWVRGLEMVIEQCYKLAAMWLNQEIPDDFAVDINNDFGIAERAADDLDRLIKMRLAGDISRETFLQEAKRRGVLAESLDLEDELERIEAEGPKLGLIDDAEEDDLAESEPESEPEDDEDNEND